MSTTITDSPNTTLVRGFYEALGRGDIEAVAGVMSPDITMLMPGRSPLAGRYNGRDAILGFLGQMQAVAGGTFHAELREVYSSDTSVVALHHGTGTREGRAPLDAQAALVFELEDGAVTAVTVHQKSQDGWDDFFS